LIKDQKIKQENDALALRYRYSKAFLLILLFVLSRFSYSQENNAGIIITHLHKNAIKGFIPVLPIPGLFLAGLSVGYERNISKHSILELGSYYFFNTDEMGGQYHTFSLMPAYKYFIVSENKILNSCWISVYLSYNQNIQTVSDAGTGWNRRYYYGIGISIGKKINLSHNKRWFVDLGFGASFNINLDESIFSATKWDDKYVTNGILPRPILQFGWKF
jgi:hypothetical protein